MTNYIGAIDQGTTSTRFIVFDRSGRVVSVAQKEHEQIYPKPGWVEHNAEEIWQRTREVIAEAMSNGKLKPQDLAAIGITNQRETTVVWNRKTGKPLANALVWQDTRVADYVSELAKAGEDEGVRFAALAARLNTTPGTLRRAFLQVTGLRPRDLAAALRVARFKKMLREGTMPPAVLAEVCKIKGVRQASALRF